MEGLLAGRRALIVDDDEIVRAVVAAALQVDGVRVSEADRVDAALDIYRRGHFDFVVVDVNLPDGLGFDLVALLKRHRDCAVLYLTSRGDTGDRVRGLMAGGDDYLVKPIELAELRARLIAVLRRYRKTLTPPPRLIAANGWTLDLVRRELASADGYLVPLTRGEFDLFSALVQASPAALDRDYLLEVVASADATGSARTIDVMISRIRAKLEAAPAALCRIVTVRGGGYRFAEQAA